MFEEIKIPAYTDLLVCDTVHKGGIVYLAYKLESDDETESDESRDSDSDGSDGSSESDSDSN